MQLGTPKEILDWTSDVLYYWLLFTITATILINLLVIRSGETRGLWQIVEVWQMLIYLHLVHKKLSAHQLYFAQTLFPLVNFNFLKFNWLQDTPSH